MIRTFAVFAAAVMAVAFSCQNADALERHHDGKKLAVVALGVGAASTAGYFAINDWRWHGWENSSGLTQTGAIVVTTVGCIAIAPIVATLVLNRPLTYREAGVLAGSCIIPIIGGWLVNAAYEAHPEWDPEDTARRKGHKSSLFPLFSPGNE